VVSVTTSAGRDVEAPGARLVVPNASVPVNVAVRRGSPGAVILNTTELIVAAAAPVFCRLIGIEYRYSVPERMPVALKLAIVTTARAAGVVGVVGVDVPPPPPQAISVERIAAGKSLFIRSVPFQSLRRA
jgi:hypothetical protein